MSLFDKMINGMEEQRPSSGNKMLDALLGMAGVTPEQLQQVQTLGAKAGEFVAEHQAQMNRIEANQQLIIGMLRDLSGEAILGEVNGGSDSNNGAGKLNGTAN